MGLTLSRKIHLTLCAALLFAGAARAETLVCSTTDAWRLDAGGMIAHPNDFYGFAQTVDLRVDPDAGTLSAGDDHIPGMELRSRPDTATGADLVYSTDDGAMLFRARFLDSAIPFLLIDTYDIYVGSCER